MNPHPGQQIGFLDGTNDIIDEALNRPNGGYSSITAARSLNERERAELDMLALIHALWSRIAVNWVEAGCQSRGKSNWRWQLSPKTAANSDVASKQKEIILQRRIAGFSQSRWSNETPTGSGLSGSGSGEPGGLDLAYVDDNGDVHLVELKIGSNTPVHAAFQVVRYGLALILARLVDDQVSIITKGPSPGGEIWRNAKHAHLRVLAPAEYYQEYLNLGWLESRLDAAILQFGTARGLPMSFGFRQFADANKLQQENDVIECLGDSGRVPWTKPDTNR